MHVCYLLLVALFAPLAGSQAVKVGSRVPGVTVSGVVNDSIARKPLADAVVQLVAADNPRRFVLTARSDSLGRFEMSDVPAGRYTLGFFHPMLDSLGLEVPLREVYVDGIRPVRAELAIPTLARLRAAICGEQSLPDSGTLVIGIVRDAKTGSPAAGVTVTGEWLELSLRRNRITRLAPRVIMTTAENGWFAMCNVPTTGTMTLIASQDADSTDLIEVDLPPGRFLRHELYLARAPAFASEATAQRSGTIASESGPSSFSVGRLTGRVVTVAGDRPVPGAEVSMGNGPPVRANERGEWTLVDVPAGTRMLEVRALGYYPQRRRVHVVADAAPVNIALSTFKAVLDTVRIRATRLSGPNIKGFHERRRTGGGRYLTPDDIARRPAFLTSDIFRTVQGVRLGYASDTLATDMMQRIAPDSTREFAKRILIRGITGNWCAAAVYMDGVLMPAITADDVDAWIRPVNVAGIEIYSEASVPGDFQRARSGCGSVVIWTK